MWLSGSSVAGAAEAYMYSRADYVPDHSRDAHGLNISVLGPWNEAWQAAGRPETEPWEYIIALRKRLDSSGLKHVRIIVPGEWTCNTYHP